MRGKADVEFNPLQDMRITPAYAGKSFSGGTAGEWRARITPAYAGKSLLFRS